MRSQVMSKYQYDQTDDGGVESVFDTNDESNRMEQEWVDRAKEVVGTGSRGRSALPR